MEAGVPLLSGSEELTLARYVIVSPRPTANGPRSADPIKQPSSSGCRKQ